jgi:ketose-bisphosphate aldolase
MSLLSYTEILTYAKKHRITVGAFNCFNMETAQALVAAAETQNSPLIVQTYHAHVDYAGSDCMHAIVDAATKNSNAMIALGLDHGKSYEQAKQCINSGYSGVMIDLSAEDYELNVRETRRVVELAHSRNVSVEAELGKIIDADSSYDEIAAGYTDVDVARRFVQDTGIDCLAVSIGTAHGLYKYQPKINFILLEELISAVNCPIVVHGGSGVPDEDIERMVLMGVAKINVGTDFFEAFKNTIYNNLVQPDQNNRRDIVEILREARLAVQEVAEQKMKLLSKHRV